MIQFTVHNRWNTQVEIVSGSTVYGTVPDGNQKDFSAPEGEIWQARQQGIPVSTYQVSPRVVDWVVPAARVGLPVPLRAVHSGPYNESLQPCSDIPFLAGTGKLRAVMLFVDFADVRVTTQGWADEDKIIARVVGDAPREIEVTSFGALELTVAPERGWRNLSRRAQDYADSDCHCVSTEMRRFIEETANLYLNVDFSQYDLVYIVAANSPDFALSPVWSARDYEVIQAPQGEIRHAVVFGADSYKQKNKTFLLLHETYHLLGLPDLYDGGAVDNQGYSDLGLIDWDLMAHQGGDRRLLGWHRLKLGWLHSSQVVCLHGPGTIRIDLADWSTPKGVKAVMVPVTVDNQAECAHLAYIVEVAEPKGGGASQGVLVYSVNAALPTWERPIQMRGGADGLSAQAISPGSSYSHLSGIAVENIKLLPGGGFEVEVTKDH